MKARYTLQFMVLLFFFSRGVLHAQPNCNKPVLNIMSNEQLVVDIEATPAKGKESAFNPKTKLVLVNAEGCPQRHSYSFSMVEAILVHGTMRLATAEFSSPEINLSGWGSSKLSRIVFTLSGLYDTDTNEKSNEKFSYIWLIK